MCVCINIIFIYLISLLGFSFYLLLLFFSLTRLYRLICLFKHNNSRCCVFTNSRYCVFTNSRCCVFTNSRYYVFRVQSDDQIVVHNDQVDTQLSAHSDEGSVSVDVASEYLVRTGAENTYLEYILQFPNKTVLDGFMEDFESKKR